MKIVYNFLLLSMLLLNHSFEAAEYPRSAGVSTVTSGSSTPVDHLDNEVGDTTGNTTFGDDDASTRGNSPRDLISRTAVSIMAAQGQVEQSPAKERSSVCFRSLTSMSQMTRDVFSAQSEPDEKDFQKLNGQEAREKIYQKNLSCTLADIAKRKADKERRNNLVTTYFPRSGASRPYVARGMALAFLLGRHSQAEKDRDQFFNDHYKACQEVAKDVRERLKNLN